MKEDVMHMKNEEEIVIGEKEQGIMGISCSEPFSVDFISSI
jgi:hypothetical protein